MWQYEFEMMKGPYKSMYWIGKQNVKDVWLLDVSDS